MISRNGSLGDNMAVRRSTSGRKRNVRSTAQRSPPARPRDRVRRAPLAPARTPRRDRAPGGRPHKTAAPPTGAAAGSKRGVPGQSSAVTCSRCVKMASAALCCPSSANGGSPSNRTWPWSNSSCRNSASGIASDCRKIGRRKPPPTGQVTFNANPGVFGQHLPRDLLLPLPAGWRATGMIDVCGPAMLHVDFSRRGASL